MFDLRRPIKIFVANGEVRYGTRVDNGFFPVYSVQEEEDAKVLVEALPWVCTDTLTTYAQRLESMCGQVVGAKAVDQSEEFLDLLEAEKRVKTLSIELGVKSQALDMKHRDHLFSAEDAAKREQLREALAQFNELNEKVKKPNPIALAIMGASEEDNE